MVPKSPAARPRAVGVAAVLLVSVRPQPPRTTIPAATTTATPRRHGALMCRDSLISASPSRCSVSPGLRTPSQALLHLSSIGGPSPQLETNIGSARNKCSVIGGKEARTWFDAAGVAQVDDVRR